MPRKNFTTDPDIQAALDTICQRYKLAREADAIRLALMVLAASPIVQIPSDFNPHRPPGPKPFTQRRKNVR